MNLSDVYSYIDSKKRAIGGLLAEPGLTIDKYVSQFREDNRDRLNLQANAYPMAGDKTVLNSPHQLDQFRKQLADEGANMGMAGMFVGKGSKTWDTTSAQKALELEKQAGDLESWVSRINEFGDGFANKAYKNLAGEAEARATQARIPLDAAQRRALFPADSYDVPMDQLIIRGLMK